MLFRAQRQNTDEHNTNGQNTDGKNALEFKLDKIRQFVCSQIFRLHFVHLYFVLEPFTITVLSLDLFFLQMNVCKLHFLECIRYSTEYTLSWSKEFVAYARSITFAWLAPGSPKGGSAFVLV